MRVRYLTENYFSDRLFHHRILSYKHIHIYIRILWKERIENHKMICDVINIFAIGIGRDCELQLWNVCKIPKHQHLNANAWKYCKSILQIEKYFEA